MSSNYPGIIQTLRLISRGSHHGRCPSCGFDVIEQELDRAINHFLDHDDWVLLHVGTETDYDAGKLHHYTVAMVGMIES
jgi:hypothetical protein